MYLIDREKFLLKTKHGISESDFVLCRTDCCARFLVEDVELPNYYVDPLRLDSVIFLDQNSNCPFCSSNTWNYQRIENFDEQIEETNPWREFFIDDLLVADVRLTDKNSRADEILTFLVDRFERFSFDLRFSLFKDDKTKQMSIHGVLSEFTSYFRERHPDFSESQLRDLFALLEKTFSTEDEVNNAVCTCFLENIAGEGLTGMIEPYIGPNSRKYYDAWGG